jgi:hypothetical protein
LFLQNLCLFDCLVTFYNFINIIFNVVTTTSTTTKPVPRSLDTPLRMVLPELHASFPVTWARKSARRLSIAWEIPTSNLKNKVYRSCSCCRCINTVVGSLSYQGVTLCTAEWRIRQSRRNGSFHINATRL